MTTVQWNKLVRDRIPEIIERDGTTPVTRVLDVEEFIAALKTKLIEEAQEARAAPPGSLQTELADLLEVVYALATATDITLESLEAMRSQRAMARGSFRDRIFLVETRSPASEV